ncbi:MAG TPA: hypothetical protein VFI50_02350, partial [Casimicrobiaceae bacterium]|nr:hypothetical protein [Casimicrobiaceae bacterium]
MAPHAARRKHLGTAIECDACFKASLDACPHFTRNCQMPTERYQRGLDRMMELVSGSPSNTFNHVKLVAEQADDAIVSMVRDYAQNVEIILG